MISKFNADTAIRYIDLVRQKWGVSAGEDAQTICSSQLACRIAEGREWTELYTKLGENAAEVTMRKQFDLRCTKFRMCGERVRSVIQKNPALQMPIDDLCV